MVDRRRFLRLSVAAVATSTATVGCLGGRSIDGDSPGSGQGDAPKSTPDALEDGPVTTPETVPEWTPDWTMSFEGSNVLGLDAADDVLYATVSDDDSASAVAAVDPQDASTLWQRSMEGEAVAGSHSDYQRISRGGWGVTLTADSVFAVAGAADSREWTAVHAFDRTTGERRWSFERDRELAVAGVAEGTLVVAGEEFFPPPGVTPTSHQTPKEPLSTVVYAVDARDGSLAWSETFTSVRDVGVTGWSVCVAAADGLHVRSHGGETLFSIEDAPTTWVEGLDERLFLLTGEGSGAALSGVAPSGEIDWRYDVPVEELLLAGDRLYAGGESVWAVESDGTVVWRDDDYGQWLLVDPDGDALYTRSGRGADAATAYDTAGEERWTFDPPSDNAWPEAATADRLVATAITGETAAEPFYTVYSVDANGEATAAIQRDTVFDALGLDGTVYLADGESNLLALTP